MIITVYDTYNLFSLQCDIIITVRGTRKRYDEKRKIKMKNQENAVIEETNSSGKKNKKSGRQEPWPVMFIIAFLIMLVAEIFGGVIKFFMDGIADGSGMREFAAAAYYVPFIMYWVALILYCRISKKDRPVISTVTTKLKGNNIKMFAVGTAIGLATNGLCILAAFLHNDIELSFSQFNLLSLVLLSVSVLIQSAAEEFVCRGFLYYKLQNKYKKPVIYITLNSVFFGLCHLGNSGVTALSICNIVFIGILFSLIVYFTDSLWAAFAAHAAWNFNQNIIFGLPNSGMESEYSVFSLNAESAKNSIFYNVDFGVEGTVFVVLVIAVSCAAIYFIGKKTERKDRYDIWAEETAEDSVLAQPVNV